jgi:hypothetical protein
MRVKSGAVFYTIYEGNIVSFQCEKSIMWFISMRDVDCMSLISMCHCLHQAVNEFSTDI